MTTLKEIRQQYPEYNHASDEQLADAMYEKYYSHSPREVFNEKIGFKTQEEQGFFNKLPRNIGAGLLEAVRGIGNIPHQLHLPNAPYFEPTNFSEMTGITGTPTLSDKIIQGISQFAPSIALPAANIGRAGQAIGSIPKIGKFAQGAIKQAIPQSAYGATQNENPLIGAAEGGIGSVAGSALGSALEKGFNALRPSRLLKSNLSPEKLKENLKVTKGTETGLGQVIENPLLKRLHENVLPNVLGSKAEKIAQKNASKIQEKGTNLLNELKGDTSPHEFGVKLQDALKSATQEARFAKNANFNKLNELSDTHGLKISRENFQNAASDIIQNIEQSPELKHEFGKDLYNDLIRYSKNKEGNTLKLTNIFRGKLGDKANELYQSGKMYEYGIVNDLKTALSNDIEHAFEQSGKPELKEAYAKSQKEYKENFAPFEDKDIVKFTRQGGDPDLILNHFLKGGGNDRATLLAKLDRAYNNHTGLQEPSKNLLPSAYLSRAFNDEGELNPIKFRSLYNKLGHNQRKVLFGDGKLHKEIKDYSDLVGKNLESFNLMFNPKTGARLSTLAQAALIPAHIPSALGAALASRGATKLLTSPGFREKLVNAMIKGKDIKLPKTKNALQKGSAIAAGLSVQDKEQKPLELLLTKGR